MQTERWDRCWLALWHKVTWLVSSGSIRFSTSFLWLAYVPTQSVQVNLWSLHKCDTLDLGNQTFARLNLFPLYRVSVNLPYFTRCVSSQCQQYNSSVYLMFANSSYSKIAALLAKPASFKKRYLSDIIFWLSRKNLDGGRRIVWVLLLCEASARDCQSGWQLHHRLGKWTICSVTVVIYREKLSRRVES